MEKQCGCIINGENEGYRLNLVRSSSFGRKRVALSKVMDEFDYTNTIPLKKHCCMNSFLYAEKSPLETLPQDILIKIICGVEHDDLKRLFYVSKTIRDATLIAKQCHFEYSTPTKTIPGVKIGGEINDLNEFQEIEAPNAPIRSRVCKSRFSGKNLTDITVALFASADEDSWTKRGLFIEMETEI